MICESLNRPFFIKNLLRYLAEKILLLNTTNLRGDYLFESTGRKFSAGDYKGMTKFALVHREAR